jgi:hypothetical protein
LLQLNDQLVPMACEKEQLTLVSAAKLKASKTESTIRWLTRMPMRTQKL